MHPLRNQKWDRQPFWGQPDGESRGYLHRLLISHSDNRLHSSTAHSAKPPSTGFRDRATNACALIPIDTRQARRHPRRDGKGSPRQSYWPNTLAKPNEPRSERRCGWRVSLINIAHIPRGETAVRAKPNEHPKKMKCRYSFG